ncbi:transcription initiation factor TFIIH subunit 3 [Nematocida sp. AWRm77]|nr:transcription initiation factor TFIIH subunit 3 [Nematocida sp. AWRm77]
MLLILVLAGGFPIDKTALNDLLVFINLYNRTSQRSRLKIVQGLSILFDSEKNVEEEIRGAIEKGLKGRKFDSSADLGYALLLVHREKEEGRIILFSSEESYFNMIKCAFTARKLHIPVYCVISKEGLVSQMAEVFQGSSFFLSSGESFFAYLVGTLAYELGNTLVSKSKRLCMCHNNEIQIGYLCPICLGLYCKFVPLCRHCKTKFVF